MATKKDLVVLIEHLVNEAVDQALAVSDKRRKEFRSQFAKVFTEADATTAPPTDQTAPLPPAAAPAGAPPAPPVGDPTAAPGAVPAPGDPAATPGADGAIPGAEGEDPAGGDVTGGDTSGSFGGFGGGGGGGGGGAPEDDAAPAGEGDSEEGSEASEDPEGDPIENMVSGALELLNQTQDPALILKSLKGQIQAVFEQPENALGVVKALYDTKDSVLMSVAQRLYLFLKSSGQ